MRRGSLLFVGAVLFTAGLALARSEHPVVLARWSRLLAAILAAVALSTLAVGYYAWRRGRAPPTGESPGRSPALWLELSALSYGAGYLASAVADRASASRFLDLNLTGSAVPLAIVLEWVALACLAIALLFWASRYARRVPGLVLTGGSVLVLALMLEGAARLVAIIDPEVQGYPTHRSRLWRRQYVQLNQAGFRDVDHQVGAAPRTRRLLVVGDSYAMGEGLDHPDQRLAHLLGEQLTRRTGEPWEVIQNSRSDSHTLKELEFLVEGLRYRPDVIILVYVFNDIDYLRAVTVRNVVTEHPRGMVDRLRPDRFAFVNSFAWQELYLRLRHLGAGARTTHDPYADPATVARHLEDLRRFVDLGRGAGAEVYIMPFDIGVAASDQARARYERFLRDCTAAGLPLLSLRTAFDRYGVDELSVNRLDRHPNALANRLAMETALQHLTDRSERTLGSPAR